MKKLTMLMVLLTLILTACTSAASNEPALSLLDMEGNTVKTYTLKEIKKLPSVEGYAGFLLSSGAIEQPTYYKGVPLAALAGTIAEFGDGLALSLRSIDGEEVKLNYVDLTKGALAQYDPASGTPLEESIRYTAILAYELNGKKLDAENYGNFRIVVVSDEKNQVVDEVYGLGHIDEIQLTSSKISSSELIDFSNLVPQLFGDVTTPIPLTKTGLKEFNLTNQYIEDDLGHMGEFFGFYLKDLIAYAQPLESATGVQFTNVKGISGRVLLTELTACETCMLALNPDETYDLVMPGLPDAWWLKDIRLIEVR